MNDPDTSCICRPDLGFYFDVNLKAACCDRFPTSLDHYAIKQRYSSIEIRGNAVLARGNLVHVGESRNVTAVRVVRGKRRKCCADIVSSGLSQRHNSHDNE